MKNGNGLFNKVCDLQSPTQIFSSYSKILPKHGIASPLDNDKQLCGKLFCFLPLPVNTFLPVHINGQFVLSSNCRSLWKETLKMKRQNGTTTY